VAILHLLSFTNTWAQGNAGTLVGLLILGKCIYSQIVLERNQAVFVIPVVTYVDLVCIYILYHTISFCMYLDTCIACSLSFQACTYNRHLRLDKRNSLALHVRSHQGTVGIIVLQERNQRGTQTNDLVRSHVHEFHLFTLQDREVARL